VILHDPSHRRNRLHRCARTEIKDHFPSQAREAGNSAIFSSPTTIPITSRAFPPLSHAYSPEVIGPCRRGGKDQRADPNSPPMATHSNSPARTVHVISTPGHTAGHICFYIPTRNCCLPATPCSRSAAAGLFEGSPEDMFTSLSRLAELPDETRVYCGHEYTQVECRFAVTVDPDNPALAERKHRDIDGLRSKGHADACRPRSALRSAPIRSCVTKRCGISASHARHGNAAP
jgi:hypothetical protein